MNPVTEIKKQVSNAKERADEAVEEVKPWITRLARFGFASKGVVYILTGVLAIQAALGFRSAEVDQKDVLLNILVQPMGGFILLFIALGLIGYVIWRLVQAILDPDQSGKD